MRKIPERKKNEDAIEQNEENYNEMNAELSKHYVFIVFFSRYMTLFFFFKYDIIVWAEPECDLIEQSLT